MFKKLKSFLVIFVIYTHPPIPNFFTSADANRPVTTAREEDTM